MSKLKIAVPLSIFFIPIVFFVVNAQFNTRFSETSIFTKSAVLTGSFINTFGSQYFYLLDIIGRYLGYFNPYSLFVKASGHSLYRLEGLGVFNLWELPAFVVGIYSIVRRKIVKDPVFFVVVFLAALPAAVTVDWFSPLRALMLWPLYLIISAIGIKYALSHFKIKLKYLVFLTLFGLWGLYALRTVETVVYYQPYVHSGNYQYGFAQSVPYVSQLTKQHTYDNVIIDTPHAQPHIFYLFFSAYPPRQYHEDIEWRVTDYTARTNFDFGPYTFRKIYWPADRSLKNTLFVGTVFSLPYDQLKDTPNARILKEFHQPDGNISTVVVETE